MFSDQRAITNSTGSSSDDQNDDQVRDIHALTPPPTTTGNQNSQGRRRLEAWETSSTISESNTSSSSENFTTMSREFNALVVAGQNNRNNHENENNSNNISNTLLSRIREDDNEIPEETNPLAIVPDSNPNFSNDPIPSPTLVNGSSSLSSSSNIMNTSRSSFVNGTSHNHEDVSMNRVKREEIESKILAWQNAKISKVNNRFKREDAIINGWEDEQVQKATSWMKKVERRLEEKRAKALEKMQNEVAKAHRKAEERRATSEAKKGTKLARVIEIANLMRTLGRPPSKRSFF